MIHSTLAKSHSKFKQGVFKRILTSLCYYEERKNRAHQVKKFMADNFDFISFLKMENFLRLSYSHFTAKEQKIAFKEFQFKFRHQSSEEFNFWNRVHQSKFFCSQKLIPSSFWHRLAIGDNHLYKQKMFLHVSGTFSTSFSTSQKMK